MVSSGGRLSVYDTKKNYRISTWPSKECLRKLLYNSAEDIVVATTASCVHLFSNREISDALNPFLSQPYVETFTDVVLVGVSGGGCEAHMWYSADSKLKALRVSDQGITSETFRLYANTTIERMEPLGEAGDGKLKDLALSHRGCIEKWDVDKQERSAVCDCYDFCSHLCTENCKFVILFILGGGGVYLQLRCLQIKCALVYQPCICTYHMYEFLFFYQMQRDVLIIF